MKKGLNVIHTIMSFINKDGIGFKVDFIEKNANEFPFEFDVVIIE